MGLPTELLRHSKDLATRRGRPSQVNLRRATSAAYYALFHLLVSDLTDRMVPAQPVSLRVRASRAVQHGDIKQACVDVRNPTKKLRVLLASYPSDSLKAVANTFIELQDDRHAADYDPSLTLSQSSVLNSITNAESAFAHWSKIRMTEEANVFLAAIVFSKRWDR